ncbi:pheromone-regulated protein prm10 [Entomophthora muscae]|uniref:Pheromone-regulated protein prm10 n=1 Tax=Entomophthora muscae TaxID=34485 RepID=A0ACC2U6M9_9FUNG|nr:pheromone-regulated protein prm10 [Entomophthora muscae]
MELQPKHHIVEVEADPPGKRRGLLERWISRTEKVGPLEAIRGVVDAEDERDFVLTMISCLARFGAPTYEIEELVQLVSQEVQCIVLPGAAVVSFTNKRTHTSYTQLLDLAQGLELGKLAMTQEVVRRVRRGELSAGDAAVRQRDLTRTPPLVGVFGMIILFSLCGGLACVVQHGGGWTSGGLAAIQGLIIGLMYWASFAIPTLRSVFEVASMVAIGCISALLHKSTCFTSVMISSPLLLLPGLSATIALCELLRKSLIAGAVRLFYSLVFTMLMGLGACLGVRLSQVNDAEILAECQKEIDFLPGMGLALILSGLYSLFLMCDVRRQMPLSTLLGLLAFVVHRLLSLTQLSGEVRSFIITFMLALIANITTKLFKLPAGSLPLLLPSLLVLGPGLVGVSGAFRIFLANPVTSSHLILDMLTQATSTAISIQFANLLI